MTVTTDPTAIAPGSLAASVMRYGDLMIETAARAKAGVSDDELWVPISRLVATETFRRVGPLREEWDWQGYTRFLTPWARTTEFNTIFRRISETGNLVFLELTEHNTHNGVLSVVNSLSLYRFDAGGRIDHLQIYLQLSPEAAVALSQMQV